MNREFQDKSRYQNENNTDYDKNAGREALCLVAGPHIALALIQVFMRSGHLEAEGYNIADASPESLDDEGVSNREERIASRIVTRIAEASCKEIKLRTVDNYKLLNTDIAGKDGMLQASRRKTHQDRFQEDRFQNLKLYPLRQYSRF